MWKQIIGGETIRLRSLFKESYEAVISVFLMLMCNDFPELPKSESTVRRVVVQPFNAQYTSNTKEISPENHVFPKLGDMALKRKKERLRYAMIGQLMRIGSGYMSASDAPEKDDEDEIADLPVPPTLIRERNAVLDRFDFWLRFRNDTVGLLRQCVAQTGSN